jgi:hypothetical protein
MEIVNEKIELFFIDRMKEVLQRRLATKALTIILI